MGFGLSACAGIGEDEEETGEVVQGLSMQSTSAVAAIDSGGFNSLGNPIHLVGFAPTLPPTTFDLFITAEAKWQAVESTEVTWDGDKVRQGQTLQVGRTGSTSAGVLIVRWEMSGTVNPLQLGDVTIPSTPFAADATLCDPKLGGDAYQCSVESPSLPIIPYIPVFGSPYVDFNIGITFDITPDHAIATRTLMLDDAEVGTTDLEVSDSKTTEPLAMPCNKPAGTTVDYVLDPVKWTPSALKVTQQPQFTVGVCAPLPTPIGPVPVAADIYTGPIGDPQVSNPSITLQGSGSTVSFGELQANNVNPTVDSAGPFFGSEGTPVAFSATTTSQCPISSYVWHYSNGTTSFGPNPFRTFGDDGVFDGQLTVTDITNLSGTGSFQVSIVNKAPTADAGPDTSGAWGTAIALNGQAVDPGTDDQATLTYEWNFGDGTPGAGGASVAHAYAAPGVYAAQLKVCDDNTCATDTTSVTVRKRNVAASYTGTNVGTYSAPANLAGSLLDEYGQPVVNGSLEFTLDGASAGAANTNAAGNASRTIDVSLAAGNYPVGVAYAGSAFYNAAVSSEQFVVSPIATTLAYTGSISGGANKTVNLSAKLLDALNRPLAGKLVSFRLGTQSASATTDANGIATTSLKLSQKNGQYQLTSSYAGTASKSTAASASVTFTIGGGK
jgi:PKD repeat protein